MSISFGNYFDFALASLVQCSITMHLFHDVAGLVECNCCISSVNGICWTSRHTTRVIPKPLVPHIGKEVLDLDTDKCPNGERGEHTFLCTDKIQSIFSYID